MNDLFSANALLGGVLIGLAVVLFALLNGRLLGVSGIVYGLIDRGPGVDQSRLNLSCGWRLAFLSGLLAGGAILGAGPPRGLRRVGEAVAHGHGRCRISGRFRF